MYGQRSRFRLPIPAPTPILLALITFGLMCRVATDARAHAGATHETVDAPRDGTTAWRDDPRPVPTGGVGEGGDDATGGDSGDSFDVDTDSLGVKPPNAPTVAQVLAAAYRAAGLHRDPARSLVRRARVAGLVPWLTVRVGRDSNWQTDEPTIDRRLAFEVRATWRLDRLVFDGRELQVATIEAARRRERRILATRVIRAYFAWRKAAARAGAHLATRAQALQAAAELDALTDGWFSESLGGHAAVRPKTGHPGG